MPSWLKSPTTTETGLDPASKLRGAWKPGWTRGVSNAKRTSTASTRPAACCCRTGPARGRRDEEDLHSAVCSRRFRNMSCSFQERKEGRTEHRPGEIMLLKGRAGVAVRPAAVPSPEGDREPQATSELRSNAANRPVARPQAQSG